MLSDRPMSNTIDTKVLKKGFVNSESACMVFVLVSEFNMKMMPIKIRVSGYLCWLQSLAYLHVYLI